MFGFGKLFFAAVSVVGLSGTLFVPSSSSFASPATNTPPVETKVQTSPVSPPVTVEPESEAPVAQPQSEQQSTPRAKPQTASLDNRELECLTKVMLYEAGAEGRSGQLAVAHVVMNRVRSPKFPDSICSVIYQRGQFSSIRSFKTPRNARWNKAEALARDVMEGETKSNVGSALYFHASRVRPGYVKSRTRVAQVGNHIFYR